MSLQFIHQNGGPKYKTHLSEPVQETMHDKSKVLQLGEAVSSPVNKGGSIRISGYRNMAIGAFFVAMAVIGSYLYNEYTTSPKKSSGMQNFITQSGPQENCFDNVDNNGNGLIDCDDPQCIETYYKDNDGDGFGDNDSYPPAIHSISVCKNGGGIPVGYVLNNSDCNDATFTINPSAIEICNQVDDNCNGVIDEGFSLYTLYEDNDGDLHGDPNKAHSSCTPDPVAGSTFVKNNDDCDDNNEFVNPDIIEPSCDANTIDDNCDGNDAPSCSQSVYNVYSCLSFGDWIQSTKNITSCPDISQGITQYQSSIIYNRGTDVCIVSDQVPNNSNCNPHPNYYEIYDCNSSGNRKKIGGGIGCPYNIYEPSNNYFYPDKVCVGPNSPQPSDTTCNTVLNNTDTDGDGLPDTSDNCPNTPNTDQLNTDGDTMGNACDPDDDNDGVDDVNEFIGCELIPDCDGDGIQDNIDLCPKQFGNLPNGCPNTNPSICTPGQTQSCQVSGKFGICMLGSQTCDSSGNRGVCLQTKQPVKEVCDNIIDDDCDGMIDDKDPDCNTTIIKYSCKNNICQQDINGKFTTPTCDNMCNASSMCTPGTSQQCTTTLPGICSIGKQICNGDPSQVDSQGTWGPCQAIIQPGSKSEICNDNIDNDCDGMIDDKDPDCKQTRKKYACRNNTCVEDVNGQYTNNNCNNMCNMITPICGNNKVENSEECDDGNKINGDGCSSNCKKEVLPNLCGNGKLDAGEECDDGNYINNDGCSSTCKKDAHMAGGSYRGGGNNYCGDGIKRSTEQCDDGNNKNGDGCDSNCYNELPGKDLSSSSPNHLIADAIKQMINKLKATCAYNDKNYNNILQKYKDVRRDHYRDPAVILTTFCITNGYKRKGVLGFNVNHYASVYESIKIIAKINAISEGVEFDELYPDLPRVPYRDVKKGWFTDYVNYAYEAGLLTDIVRGKELKGFTPITTNQLEILLLNAGKDTTPYKQFLKNTEITRDDMADIIVDVFKEKFVYAEYMMGENIKFYELVLKQLQGKTPAEQEAFIKNLVKRMSTWNKRELEKKLNIYVDGVLHFFDAILNLK